MNKKGAGMMDLVLAGFVLILLIVFLSGGGLGTAWDITKFVSSIPTPVWVIFGIIILFKVLGKK